MKYNIGDKLYRISGSNFRGFFIGEHEIQKYNKKINKYQLGYLDLFYTEEDLDKFYKKAGSKEEAEKLFFTEIKNEIQKYSLKKALLEVKSKIISEKLSDLENKLNMFIKV